MAKNIILKFDSFVRKCFFFFILISEFSLTGPIARLGTSGFLVLLQEAACAARTKITSFYNLPYESATLFRLSMFAAPQPSLESAK